MANVFLVALLTVILTILDYSMASVCNKENVGQRIALPASCSRFLVCAKDGYVVVGECPSGLHFNRELQMCDLPTKAGCGYPGLMSIASQCSSCDCNICCLSQTDTTPYNPTDTQTATPSTPCIDDTQTATQTPTPITEDTKTATQTPTPITDDTQTATQTPTPITEDCQTATQTPTPKTEDTQTATKTPIPITDDTTTPTPTPTPITEDTPTPTQTPTPKTEDTQTPTSITEDTQTATQTPTPITDDTPTPTQTPTPITEDQTPTQTPTLPPPSTPIDCVGVCCGKNNGEKLSGEICQQFIVCNNEKPITFNCPNNLYFNRATDACDFPQNVQCDKPYLAPGPNSGPSGTHCATGGRCLGKADGTYFPDANNKCSSSYVVCQCECEVTRSCSGPLMFNSKNGVCDWPTSFGC